MHAPETEQQDGIIETINLTSKLEKSLRKLLTNKKKLSHSYQPEEDYRRDPSGNLEKEIEYLREENKELLADNQYLSKQLLEYKEEIRELKKEVENNKKYVKFLQEYNDDLKKEIKYWTQKQERPQKIESSTRRHSSINELMNEVTKLRKQNQLRENELDMLKRSSQPRLQESRSSSLKKINFKLPKQSLKTSKPLAHREQRDNDNTCTSCNYRSDSKKQHTHTSRNKQPKKKCSKGGKDLRTWHKRFLSSEEYVC